MMAPLNRILLLDTETTGLNPRIDRVIEVAVAVYSVPRAAVLETFATVLFGESNAAAAINKIAVDLLRDGRDVAHAWGRVSNYYGEVDAVVAHGAEFDRSFVPRNCEIQKKPWICSCDDLDWPAGNGKSLVQLAVDHGLGISGAHRAAADVDLLARLLNRTAERGVDLQKFLARGLRPKATYAALVPYEHRDLAKENGFRWEPEPHKRWTRRMAVEDTASLPFAVRRLEEEVQT